MGSRSTDYDVFSPSTPDSYFSPTPAIVSPDQFTFQIDVQLDRMVGSPHSSSITHLPQSAVPSPKADPRLLPGDDLSKMQVYLRNKGRWADMYDRLESSPPLRPHNPPHVLPSPQDGASDDFSWEAAHSPLVDPDQLPDPSRCSLLIHQVSLLVGLTSDDVHLFPNDGCPLVPDSPIQVHDTLPLNLTPTHSLASGKHRNAGTNIRLHPPNLPIPPSIPGDANHSHGLPLVGSRDPAIPIPRYKNADAPCPSLSSRRRQGQVFPPLSNMLNLNLVDLDETFCHPRHPPPKPPANRSFSLDRLESSLLKLEAHAPRNHRKSQSEGRPSDHVSQCKVSRPSLPPPRRLKQQQSSSEITHRSSSRSAHERRFSGPPPVPRPIPPHQHVTPRICPPAPLDDNHFEGDPTPGSFMDMDIPQTEEPQQKRRTSLRPVKGKEKMQGLVGVAKRVGRGVIAWGKNLTGSTKPQKTTVQSARV